MTKIIVNERCGDCGFWSNGKCMYHHIKVSADKMPCREFDDVQGSQSRWLKEKLYLRTKDCLSEF